ncbi:MAG: hypothetical protein HC802_03085 [Caldilineaceae bacterium]|nr:hypothetical protein [Caldilineaceae bacterium]
MRYQKFGCYNPPNIYQSPRTADSAVNACESKLKVVVSGGECNVGIAQGHVQRLATRGSSSQHPPSGARFLLSTGVPLLIGVMIDLLSGTAPFATIIVGLISIPVSSVVVSKATLAEFDVMVEKIAPERSREDESSMSAHIADDSEDHPLANSAATAD